MTRSYPPLRAAVTGRKIGAPADGFGTYNYGFQNWPHAGEAGHYRHRFTVPASWRGRHVEIVFDGSMTDTEVTVNGRRAGPIHQGGFVQLRYDISDKLQYGRENLLEVKVSKRSADASVNRAERDGDYWIFGGIYRPVFLEARPPSHLARIALDARADGSVAVDAHLGGIRAAGQVVARITTLAGQPVGRPFAAEVGAGAERVALRTKVADPALWSAEFPNRYRVKISLRRGGRTLHEVTEAFGFRTVELRPHDGLYVNGTRVRLRGVNRHTFWPESGRTTSPAISLADVQLMKDMNMNAVRMSHYPPDRHFLDVTDSLGLYVMDELPGWQHAYDTAVGEKMVREMIVRDVNHPSVILWANGNEGGHNYALVDDFPIWDPQGRPVLHPSVTENGISTAHYESYHCCPGRFFEGDDLILPTEFLHGLYDGGHGAGLEDWWDRIVAHPLGVGGFLWALTDDAIVRTDQDGRLDSWGNKAPDGIVGPHREKEGSFFAIKEIWAPVFLPWSRQQYLPPTFDGRLQVENRFDFTSLAQVRFTWKLVTFPRPGEPNVGHRVARTGGAASPGVAPHDAGMLELGFPADWRAYDALYLTATDPHGREIYTWSWMIVEPAGLRARIVRTEGGAARGAVANGRITATADSTTVEFDAVTGRLAGVRRNGRAISFANGPRFVSGPPDTAKVTAVRHYQDGDDYVVEAEYAGHLSKIAWRLRGSGWLELDYSYVTRGDELPYVGISFDYPASQVTGLKWLGKGPYRVWKNRRRGVTFDVWHKAYNDAITGVTWQYPEFKGYHAELYWAILETKEAPITVATDAKSLYLRVLSPREPDGAAFDPMDARMIPFPDGDISFLNGIAPIGDKFRPAEHSGPEGRHNIAGNYLRRYRQTLFFFFGAQAPEFTP